MSFNVNIYCQNIKKFLLLIFIFLTGCSHTININDEFPTPIGQPYPITAGVLFNDEFTKFIHHENRDDRDEWNIHAGEAQKNLFDNVFNSMFIETINFSSQPEKIPDNIDIFFAPKILEFQFTMPRETSVNIFEVWIKYEIIAYGSSGNIITDWVITAYGKTPTAFLKSESNALKQAVSIALRDAGAILYSGFYNVPELQAFIVDKQQELSIQKSDSLIVDSIEN